ncbi:MAG: MotA/TolQ/ExbB proton channel family protein [Phycisphaerae bacterium]
MDIATLFGILLGFGGLIWAMWVGTEGHMETFFSEEGFVLVIGGSLAAVCMSMPLRSVLDVWGYVKKWLLGKELPIDLLLTNLVSYAEIARRDGMLALEDALKTQADPFLKKGLQLAIDGTDPEIIDQTLRIEINALAERHKKGKKFFELMGKYGPGFGLTATLIGQVAMFRNLGGDSASIGKALAVALLGTLYGCILCNVICGPIADKLSIRSAEEQFVREMTLVGIMSIQSGDNPHVVEMKLQSFLSERQKKALEKK